MEISGDVAMPYGMRLVTELLLNQNFGMIFFTVPALSIIKVDRTIPMKIFPYSFFSCHTPYFMQIFLFSSAINSKGRLYLSMNFRCRSGESELTPSIMVFLNFLNWSLKSQASVVQPGVMSFG